MKELEDFYTTLYKNQGSSDCDRIIPHFLDSEHVPTLRDDQKKSLRRNFVKNRVFQCPVEILDA